MKKSRFIFGCLLKKLPGILIVLSLTIAAAAAITYDGHTLDNNTAVVNDVKDDDKKYENNNNAYTKQLIKTYLDSKEDVIELECIFDDKILIPYVNVEQYMTAVNGIVYKVSFTTTNMGDGTYKISNI